MRHHLESRLGERVDYNSAIMEWLIFSLGGGHVLEYSVHENSRTTYEMTTQHAVKHKVIGFAENVYFNLKSSAKRGMLAATRKAASVSPWGL